MTTAMVTLRDLAAETGMHNTSVRRVAIRRGFLPVPIRINGRTQLALARGDADKLIAARNSAGIEPKQKAEISSGVGGVYVVLPDPELRPNRIKAGWTNSFRDRLASHRSVVPELMIVRLYSTKNAWTEAMTIAALCKLGQPVGPEVFDLPDITSAVAVLDDMFNNVGIAKIQAEDLPGNLAAA
jgi:hypothetical protein